MNEQAHIPERTSKPRKRTAVIAAFVFALVVCALTYWLLGRGWVSTDDAQVEGDLVPISPRVSGYVSRIHVRDNQMVSAGDLLVQLDRRDLSAKLHKSEADLATQRAQAAAASTQVPMVERTSKAGEAQAGASVTAAEAEALVSGRQVAAAQAQAESAQANADAASDAITSARSDVEIAKAQIEAARAAVKAAEADVVAAEAHAKRAASEASRFQKLFDSGAASQDALEEMQEEKTSTAAALKAAGDRVTSASAALDQAKARKAASDAGLKQTISKATAARAAARQATAGLEAARGAYQAAEAHLEVARAARSGAQTSPQQVSISVSQSKAAAARIRQSEADIRSSRLQLSYTRIRAPVAGVVSEKSVQPGEFVQPGQLLMALVPLTNTWVVANFKETQIGRMRKWQPVRVEVDTYPGITFHGHIDSIGAATGAKFSLLPPQNATGNFVKVVQRMPVKIVLDRPGENGVVLRPGMNVIARVNLRSRRS